MVLKCFFDLLCKVKVIKGRVVEELVFMLLFKNREKFFFGIVIIIIIFYVSYFNLF